MVLAREEGCRQGERVLVPVLVLTPFEPNRKGSIFVILSFFSQNCFLIFTPDETHVV